MKKWLKTGMKNVGTVEMPYYVPDIGECETLVYSRMKINFPNEVLLRISGTKVDVESAKSVVGVIELTDDQAERQIKAKWISDVSGLTAEKFFTFLDDLTCSDSDRELIQPLRDDYTGITVDEIITKFDDIPTLLDDIGHFVDLENLDIADPEIDAIAEANGLDPHKIRAGIQTASRGKQVLQDQENYLMAMISTKKIKSKQFWDEEAVKSGKYPKGIDIENGVIDGKGVAHEFVLSRLR